MTVDLRRSTAVVTGGARGIGLELTRQLVARGAKVVAIGRSLEHLRALQAEFPASVTIRAVDLSSRPDVDRLVADLCAEVPEINILVNNAGVQNEMDLLELQPGEACGFVRSEIAINLDSVVVLTLGLLPIIARHDRGAIINVSSGLAIAPKAASPVYCATKAAVRSFTKALRYQCNGRAPQIEVSEAIMALVDTDMTRGRGSGKISAARAALEVLSVLDRYRPEVWVGKAKLLRFVNRLSPALAERIMR
jgi:uncharacterized oxidoreductase